MATLLLWLSWRDAELPAADWAPLLARARMRTRFSGSEVAGPGFRIFAARTRDAEPSVLVECHGEAGEREILLLDRANGANDGASREEIDWTAARLLDGTPTAAIRLFPSSHRVELFRDLMGQRKLVFARIHGGVVIASGEDMLLAHPEVSAELDPMFLAAYFAALSPAAEETVFRDVRSLCSGETLTVDARGHRSAQLTLEPVESWRTMDDGAVVSQFAELFHRGVENACRGARRIGVSLSAGLDSSSVAAVAARLPHPENRPIVAVTQGFDEFPDIDERPMASMLARELGIEFQSFAADRLFPYSDRALRPICPDQPQQSPYREWKEMALHRFAESGVDIRLAGDFGDHLFAGSVEWVIDAIRFRRFCLLARQLAHLARHGKAVELMNDTALRRPLSRSLGRVDDLPTRLAWLREPYAAAIRERLRAELQCFRDFPRPQHCVSLMNAAAAFDASGEHWFLQRHGLEQRMPFRDLELTRWCLSIPADFSLRNGQRKWILREAMRGVLPEALRLRQKGSDLIPVFNRAVKSQHAVLAQYMAMAAPVASRFLVEVSISTGKVDRGIIADWLSSSFGAWWAAWSVGQ